MGETTDDPKNELPNVVITGFGPFRDIEVNPSWEAIKDPIVIDRPVNVIVKQIPVKYRDVDEIVPKLWRDYKPILMVHIGVAARTNVIRIECCARQGPYIGCDLTGSAPHERELNRALDELIHMTHDDGVLSEQQSIDTNTIDNNEPEKGSDEGSSYSSNTLSTSKQFPKNTVINIRAAVAKLKERKFRECCRTQIDPIAALNAINESPETKLSAYLSTEAGLYLCEYIYLTSLAISGRTVFIHVPSLRDVPLEEIKAALKLAIEKLVDEAVKMSTSDKAQKLPARVCNYDNLCNEYQTQCSLNKLMLHSTEV